MSALDLLARPTVATAKSDTPTRRLSPRKLIVTPAVLAVALLATYAWISTRDLDSIERTSLSGANVAQRLREQVELVAVSTLFVLVIAIPLGVLMTRKAVRAAAPLVMGAANLGQAVPAIGLIVLLALWTGVGEGTALIAMVAYAVLPVLANTMSGLRGVDPQLTEAARGIGMSARGVLARVELPLAVPLILAGVRNALVLNVGTATLAAFVNAGGLGDLIQDGILTQRPRVLIVGSVLAVVLALLVDWLASLAEQLLRPRGLEVG
ncbi:ABC transporter permease [Streptomyces pathocidini]|uniref:ABC transporter permease n=1 Tax=Streptomyces pathocidini TaxID=1650571 RepID=UPI00340D6FCE